MKSVALLLALSAPFAGASSSDIAYLEKWVDRLGEALSSSADAMSFSASLSIPALRTGFFKQVAGEIPELLADVEALGGVKSEFAYFNFFPQIMGSMMQDGSASESWESDCYASNTASMSSNSDNTFTMTISSSGANSDASCQDNYVFLTVTGHTFGQVTQDGDSVQTSFTWTPATNMSDAEVWDFDNKGVRVHRFLTSVPSTLANILETLLMFEPEFTRRTNPRAEARNVAFLSQYAGFDMAPHDGRWTEIPEEEIHSGDFFGIVRLDGLDPMLAWAMGSTTGHVTTAIWMDGELYVAESTVDDSYWPTNGIQYHKYRDWVYLARRAGFNAVHIPLNEKARAAYDESKAKAFLMENYGTDYGYQVMLWSWLDTLYDNYPCLPPDFSSNCLQWELVETLFALVDRRIPQLANVMWNQAWNFRLNSTSLPTADLYERADELGMTSRYMPTIPEDDEWRYNTLNVTTNEVIKGHAMVCCVFVCNMWKAAGVFDAYDAEVNCGEFTNWDDYSMDIFGETYTQILGDYVLTLNDYNSKLPFSHMAESCPSHAPDYDKPADC